MRRLALITLTISATLLGFFLLWVFQPALVLFGGSLAVSAALRPLVQRLEQRGIGRGPAILIWYLLILAVLGLGLFFYGVALASEVSATAEQVPRLYTALLNQWRQGTPLQQMLARGMPDFSALVQAGAASAGVSLIGGTLAGIAESLVSNLVFLLAVLSLAYYWLMEVTHFERLWLSLLPVGARVRARDIWRNTEAAVGAYIHATVMAIALAGLLLLLLYSVLDLPFATVLALLGGLGHLVPRLGPTLALIPALLVALTSAPAQTPLVLLGGAAIQLLAHKAAVRTMQVEALRVNPLLQVLVLLALADLAGMGAMVFGPPLAALIQVLYANLILTSAERRTQESALDLLLDRLERLRTIAPADRLELTSTLRRSDELLRQARVFLPERDERPLP